MSECENQIGIPVDENATFYIYCSKNKGHNGKHFYKAIDREGRNFNIRWTNESRSTEKKSHE